MMFFIVSKKNITVAGIALAAILTLGLVASAVNPAKAPSFLVVIDAGHGEPDGGCVGHLGSVEQKINLSVAKKVSEILEAKNIDTLLTREDSLGLWTEKSKTIREKKIEDMKKRVEIMEKSKGDLFISIHMNSYPNKNASGLRVFYDNNHEDVKELAEGIQSRMSDVTGAKSYAVKPAERTLYLLKNTPMPAVLIECGFLSNPDEEKRLAESEYQARLAWAIADAIEKHFLQVEINQK